MGFRYKAGAVSPGRQLYLSGDIGGLKLDVRFKIIVFKQRIHRLAGALAGNLHDQRLILHLI